MEHLLTLIVFAPTLGALACLIVPKEMVRTVALGATIITFGLSLMLFPTFLGGGDPDQALTIFGSSYGDTLHFVQRIPWITSPGWNETQHGQNDEQYSHWQALHLPGVYAGGRPERSRDSPKFSG